MNFVITRCLGICLVLLCGATSQASEELPIFWRSLSMEHGLSQDSILSIHQDTRGFIWITTENGINRYDGNDVDVFYRGITPGLTSDYIWMTTESQAGDLYFVSNEDRVIRRDHATGAFADLNLQWPDYFDGRGGYGVSAIAFDAQNRLWVGTSQQGLAVFTAEGTLIISFLKGSALARQLNSLHITRILALDDNSIWVGTKQGAFHIADDGTIKRHVLTDTLTNAEGAAGAHVASLMLADDGALWIGTYRNGVYRAEPGRDAQPVALAGLPNDRTLEVRAILQDRAGRIWVGTERGIQILSAKGQSQRAVRHDPTDVHGLRSDMVMSLHEDRTGIIWVGMRGGGVARWSPSNWALGPRTPKELSGVHINAFATMPDSTVWMGTIGAGLIRITKTGQVLNRFDADNGYHDLIDDRIMSLLADTDGNLWIGTLSAGLFVFNTQTGSLFQYPPKTDTTPGLRSGGIMSLAQMRNGMVAVGMYDGGVSLIDHPQREIRSTPFPLIHSDMDQSRATALSPGENAELWVGTENLGLARVDIETGTVNRYRHAADNPLALPSDSIFSVHVDERGDVWIGTSSDGLVRITQHPIDSEPRVVHRVTSSNGLAGNAVYGIEVTANGTIWASTNKGLAKVDPATMSTQVYRREHGLFGDEFNFGAHAQATDGMLYFAGTGGFNAFQPDTIETRHVEPVIQLTGFEKFNQPGLEGIDPTTVKRLNLTHKDSVITFEFSLMDFSAPDKNRYQFRMDGFDDVWKKPGPHNRATYTNLDPGDYTFRFKGVNSDGVSSPEKSIRVTITPPIWKTPWAYAAYILGALLSLALFLHWNMRSQERKARMNHLAFYDQLTGLPNRGLFMNRVRMLTHSEAQTPSPFGVYVVRVHLPRSVMESLGRKGREAVMQEVATRLLQTTKQNAHTDMFAENLARLDETEFVILVQGVDRDDIETKAHRFAVMARSTVGETVSAVQHQVAPNLSFGLATAPEHGVDVEGLIQNATTAASQAAYQGLAECNVYDTETTKRANERLELENRLRSAIRNGDLQMYFQPRFDRYGICTGAEALVRWDDEKMGSVSPELFVSMAEESGLIFELDQWVFAAVCSEVARLNTLGLDTVPVAINLSAPSLCRNGILQDIDSIAEQTKVLVSKLEIELTESALAHDPEQLRINLNGLKARGFSIALDDFGTGYSSLSHLHDFPIDIIKIDRTFVAGLDLSESKRKICRSIVALANSLSIRTVGEGVETTGEQEILMDMGCQEIQGYLLGRPMNAGQLQELLRSNGTSAGSRTQRHHDQRETDEGQKSKVRAIKIERTSAE